MRFGFVTVFVSNMARSLAFYQTLLGLPLLRQMQTPGGQLAFLGKPDEPSLELISDGETHSYNGFSIGIEVDDLDAATALLAENGYAVHRGPVQPNPQTRFSFVRDPDGIEIELIEQR